MLGWQTATRHYWQEKHNWQNCSTYNWWQRRGLTGSAKIGHGTRKEQAEACLSTPNDWDLRNRVRGILALRMVLGNIKNYWLFLSVLSLASARISLGCLICFPPSRHGTIHLLLFLAPILAPLEGLMSPCSGGCSKAGHILARQRMKWLPFPFQR